MSSRIGDIGESRFITKCLEYGYHPCKPFSSSTKFDILLSTDQKCYKVQIKTTQGLRKGRGRYEFNLGHGNKKKHCYNHYDVDFIACYVIDSDDFFIIFRSDFEGRMRLNIYPNGKYEYFKNRFDLL